MTRGVLTVALDCEMCGGTGRVYGFAPHGPLSRERYGA